MNPFGFIIIGLGLILIVIGFKGTQHQILADLTGHALANPTSTAQSSGNTTGGNNSPVQAV